MKKFLGLILLILVIAAGVSLTGEAQGGVCGECGQHCAKVEAPGPFVFDVEAWGQNESTIKSIYVSAGELCSVFTSDGENWCYAASGIGGKVASARMLPTSAECPVIDYVLFNWTAPFLTLTPEATNTPPPTFPPPATETPTAPSLTSTPWMVTQPPRPSPSPTPEITNTPPGTPETPTPVATATPEPTPTHPPKAGSIRLFGYCVNEDGSHGVDYEKFRIDTNNMGQLNGYAWPPVGHVGTWATPWDTGTTVLDAGPGECWRGGDDYPADQTRYDLQAQPIFGAGNVGNGAVVCERPCISTTQTFELPNAGGVRPYGNRR